MATETKDMVKADVVLLGSLKTEKDRMAAIGKMEIGANDATLNRRFSVYMWKAGQDTSGNAAPASDAYLKAFNSAFRGGSTGRPIVKEDSSTFKTMASVYGAFAELGFQKSWKSEAALVWILDNVKGPYSTRGKFIRSVAELKEEPDGDTLATMWKDAQNPPKLASKAVAMAKAVKELAKEPAFAPTLRDNANVRVAFQKAVLALAAFETAVKSVGGESGDDDVLAEIMKDAA